MIDRIRAFLGRKVAPSSFADRYRELDPEARDMRRAGWRQEMDRLESEREADAIVRRRAVDDATERVMAVRRDLEAAEAALGQEVMAARQAASAFETRIAICRERLCATASPTIDEAVAEMRSAWDATLASSDTVRRGFAVNPISDQRRLQWLATDRPARLARLDAIREALGRLEALRVEPIDEAELLDRIGEIEASVPRIADSPVYSEPGAAP